jgi:L-fuconolactonase
MPDGYIDAHHHLWKYSEAKYPWMLDGMESIRRDFLIPELQAAIRNAGIDGTVAVQARQTVEETEWLLDLAGGSDLIRGVVGWVPLADANVVTHLETLSAEAKLKGVRHVLHDEADDFYMLRDDFNRGVSLLRDFGLQYDILIFERHLSQTIQFVDRHPNQRFVLDHIAKPRIKDHVQSSWEFLVAELARRENVWCKLSGMVTEADWTNWTESDLRPYFDTVLAAFGAERLMFGSDWPVILVACGYKRWADLVLSWISQLSASEQLSIMGGTARRAYSL